MDSVGFLIIFVHVFRQIVVYAILFRIILSWMSMGQMRPPGRFSLFIRDLTDPVINLARKLPHRIGMFDFAPLVAMIAVELLAELIIILLRTIVV